MTAKPPSSTTLLLRQLGLRRPRQMPAEELARAVGALALDENGFEDLAEWLHVSPLTLRAWISGELAIPRNRTEDIVGVLDGRERRHALEKSGLPECEWVKARDAEMEGLAEDEKLAPILRLAKQIEAHAKTCETCLARERFLDARFGAEQGERQPRWWQRRYEIYGNIHVSRRIPAWARPGARGVLLTVRVLGFSAAIGVLPFVFFHGVRAAIGKFALPLVVPALLVLLGSVGVGGVAMGLTGRALRRFDAARHFAAAIVGVAACIGSAAVAVRLIWGENLLALFGVANAIKLLGFALTLGWFSNLGVGGLDDLANEIAPAPSPLSAPPPTPTERQ